MVQFEGYQIIPDIELFDVIPVRMNVRAKDILGRSITRVRCELYGEEKDDRREVMRQGRTLCSSCVNGTYHVAIENAEQ